ncbi:uncharacterized protein LOC142173806 [Nicotiana tabacum]|uniref:Uncharacterized protein LOC142173806 n=1 Tax=Nicotiana tabacum TaxID=4097 RepID=A0AC58TEC4_TOBAC
MMLHLHHRGGKCLVVQMDDKANHQFWLSYFFVRTEDVVANSDDFPETWNHAPKVVPPPLVRDIFNWVGRILPHIMGICEWTGFLKKFGPTSSLAGEFIYFLFLLLTSWSLSRYSLLSAVTTSNLSFSVRGSLRSPRAPPPAFRNRKASSSLEFVPIMTAAMPSRSFDSIRSSAAARSTRSSAIPTATSVSVSSPSAGISRGVLPASPLHRLVDGEEELSSSGGNLVPCKIRLVGVGDGVARAVDSVKGNFVIREMATIVLEDDIESPPEFHHRLRPQRACPFPISRWKLKGRLRESLIFHGKMSHRPCDQLMVLDVWL